MAEPLQPIWNVVHREVLVELLGLALENYVAHDEWEDAERTKRLHDETRAGLGEVLTLDRWKGKEPPPKAGDLQSEVTVPERSNLPKGDLRR